MQRTHRRQTPLTAEEVEGAREVERARQVWDEQYITAEQARSIPRDAMTPELQRRISYSQPDWPEHRMSASVALGELKPGAGERDLQPRGMPAQKLFWSPEAEG